MPNIQEANINLTVSPDVVRVLQLAVNHLAMSIDDGTYNLEGKVNEEAMMGNLYDLHMLMDNILSNLS